MNAAKLAQIWSLVLELENPNLANLSCEDLTEYLIGELQKREIVAKEEIPQTKAYLSSNIPLIHDLLYFSSALQASERFFY